MNERQLLLLIKSCNLRKKHEDILIMRYVENMSCQEIADSKGKELQTIRIVFNEYVYYIKHTLFLCKNIDKRWLS